MDKSVKRTVVINNLSATDFQQRLLKQIQGLTSDQYEIHFAYNSHGQYAALILFYI